MDPINLLILFLCFVVIVLAIMYRQTLFAQMGAIAAAVPIAVASPAKVVELTPPALESSQNIYEYSPYSTSPYSPSYQDIPAYDGEYESSELSKNGGGFFAKIIDRHADDKFIELAKEPEIESLFAKGADTSKLKVTKEGLYSITTPRLAQMIVNIIESEYGRINDTIITDATAGMGGDTITFAKHGARVNAVEKSADNFAALSSNVSAYGVEAAVNLLNQDYIEIMDDLEQDIVFADPPWTGCDYKNIECLPLSLSGIDIGDVVVKLAGKCKMVVLKVPNNFAFDAFMLKHPGAKIHDLQKFKLITVKFS